MLPSTAPAEIDAFLFLLCGADTDRWVQASDLAKLLVALHAMAGRRDFLQFAGMRQEAAAVVEAHHVMLQPLMEASLLLRLVHAKLYTILPLSSLVGGGGGGGGGGNRASALVDVDAPAADVLRGSMIGVSVRGGDAQGWSRTDFVKCLFFEAALVMEQARGAPAEGGADAFNSSVGATSSSSSSSRGGRNGAGGTTTTTTSVFPSPLLGASLTACNHSLMLLCQELGIPHASAATLNEVCAWSIRTQEGCTAAGRPAFFHPDKDREYGAGRIGAISGATSYGMWLTTAKQAEARMLWDVPVTNVDWLGEDGDRRVQLHRRRWLLPNSLGLSAPTAFLSHVALGVADDRLVLAAKPRDGVTGTMNPTAAQVALGATENLETLKLATQQTSAVDPSWVLANRAAVFHCSHYQQQKLALASSASGYGSSSPLSSIADEVFDFICSHSGFFPTAHDYAAAPSTPLELFGSPLDQSSAAADDEGPSSSNGGRRWNITVAAVCNFLSILCLPKLDCSYADLGAMLAAPSCLAPEHVRLDPLLRHTSGCDNLAVRRLLDVDFLACVCAPFLSSAAPSSSSAYVRSASAGEGFAASGAQQELTKAAFRMLFNEDDVFSSFGGGGGGSGAASPAGVGALVFRDTIALSQGSSFGAALTQANEFSSLGQYAAGSTNPTSISNLSPNADDASGSSSSTSAAFLKLRSFAVPLMKEQGPASLVTCQQFRLGLSAAQAMALVSAWKVLESLHPKSASTSGLGIVAKVVRALRLHLMKQSTVETAAAAALSSTASSSLLKFASHHLSSVVTASAATYDTEELRLAEEAQFRHNAAAAARDAVAPIDTAISEAAEQDAGKKKQKSKSGEALIVLFRTPNVVEGLATLAFLNRSEAALVRAPDAAALSVHHCLPRDIVDATHVHGMLQAVHFVLPHTAGILPRLPPTPGHKGAGAMQHARAEIASPNSQHNQLNKSSDAAVASAAAAAAVGAPPRRGVRLSDAAVTQVLERYGQLRCQALQTLVGGLVVQTSLRAPSATALVKNVVRAAAATGCTSSTAAPGVGFLPLALPPLKSSTAAATTTSGSVTAPGALLSALDARPVAPPYLSPALCSLIRRAWTFASYVQRDLLPELHDELDRIDASFAAAKAASYTHSHDVTEQTAFLDRCAFEQRRALLRSIQANAQRMGALAAAKIAYDVPNWEAVGQHVLASTSLLHTARDSTAPPPGGTKAFPGKAAGAAAPSTAAQEQVLLALHAKMLSLQDTQRHVATLASQQQELEQVLDATAHVKEEALRIRRNLLETLEAKKHAFRRASQDSHTTLQLDIDRFATSLSNQLQLDSATDAVVTAHLTDAWAAEHADPAAVCRRIDALYAQRMQLLVQEEQRLEALAAMVRNERLVDELSLIGKWATQGGSATAARAAQVLLAGSNPTTKSTTAITKQQQQQQRGGAAVDANVGRLEPIGAVRIRRQLRPGASPLLPPNVATVARVMSTTEYCDAWHIFQMSSGTVTGGAGDPNRSTASGGGAAVSGPNDDQFLFVEMTPQMVLSNKVDGGHTLSVQLS